MCNRYGQNDDLWEQTRMEYSGVSGSSRITEANDRIEKNVQLVVHKVNPKFLKSEGSISKTTLGSIVMPVLDPTSDMAVLARKGSVLVREFRRKKEIEAQLKHSISLPSNRSRHVTENKDSNNSKTTADESIWAKRKALPAFACRTQLLKAIRENQIIVVVGETGSGKTTQLTQFMHEEGYHRHGMVGCTQPRRVAAVSVAKRVSEEVGCRLGTTVGYSIRFEDCTSPDTTIKYMTDGILLREILKDNDLESYSAIIIDEAHERSLQTDVLLGLLKPLAERRRDIRIIITSATMNAEKFSDFFGQVPIFMIPGRTHMVDVIFAKTIPEDYVEAAVKQAITIHFTQNEGDILIFMTGQEDIETTANSIKEKLSSIESGQSKGFDLVVMPIYSQLPSELQSRIFEPLPGKRKCIIATNIAETSLTVEGVKYVIDTGFCKVKVYNPHIGMDTLQIFPISQAAANQRAGRAGRTGPGICYRLYTEASYNQEFLPFNVPEILRTNLSNVVLMLKSLNINDVVSFQYLDRPPEESLILALKHLWILGALNDDEILTSRGKLMGEFPLDPSLSLLLLSANEEKCSDDAAIIVSMLSVPGVFYRPKDLAKESFMAHEKFFSPESDHLSLANVFRQWVHHQYSEEWAERNFLIGKSLSRALEIKGQLVEILRQLKITISTAGDEKSIRRSIARAYVHRVAKLKKPGEYYNVTTGAPCFVHPSSALFGSACFSDYVVYHELVLTTKEYMQYVTCIEPEWIAQACPALFSLRIVEYLKDGVSSKIVSYKEAHSIPKKKHLDSEGEQLEGRKELARPKSTCSFKKRGFPGSN